MGNERRTSKPGQEEEYQFGDERFAEGLDVPEEAASAEIKPKAALGLGAMLKKYRLLVVLLIVIIAIGVLRFATNRDKTAETTQTAAVPTMTTAPKTAVTEPSATQQQKALDNLFKEEMVTLEQKTTADASDIANVQKQVGNLTISINKVNQTLQSMQDSLMDLKTELRALKAKQAAQLKPKQKTVVVRQPAAPKIKYTVRAVVPGRAWLQSSQGQTLSVAVGDVVPGYGKVTRINPEQGLVMLSSGSRFGYGEHDS